MKWQIENAPAFSTLKIELNIGEQISAQPDSMLSMTSGIKVSAKINTADSNSKLARGVKNILSGESFFTATYAAIKDESEIILAPEYIGDIISLDVQSPYYLASGSFLAADSKISLTPKYLGIKGLFSKKGLYVLQAEGNGILFLASNGNFIKRNLSSGERFIVDSKYVIAYQQSLKYELVKVAEGLKDSFFSGEGLVNQYTGPGEIVYQTRARKKDGFLLSMLKVGGY